MDNEQRQLLQKFLNGQCSKNELRQVDALLDTPEGKSIMLKLMVEKDITAGLYALPSVDETNLNDKVQGWKVQVHGRIASTKKIEKRPVRGLLFLRQVAMWAGIIFISGIAIWQIRQTIFRDQSKVYIVKKNLRGVPIQYVLPDSTSVYLGAGSSFSYSRDYPKSGRDVELQGAAFFDVKRDEVHPFTIHTGEVETRVLGTSFRVSAFAGEPLEVAVATGEVGVSTVSAHEKKELATLTPGSRITYDVTTGEFQLGKTNIADILNWRTGRLVFDESLAVVSMELERRYDIDIEFANSQIATCRVSGSFSGDENITEIMDVLSFVGKFRYKKVDRRTYKLYKSE